MKTIAFVYKWVSKVSGKWYIGSRTAKNCHPNDGYICSSRKLKPLILESRNEWDRIIICIGNPTDMLTLETKLLIAYDAKHDPMSFNLHNGDGKFTTAGKESWNKGLTVGPLSEALKAKLSASKKGKKKPPRSVEHCANMRVAKLGVNKGVSYATLYGEDRATEVIALRSGENHYTKQPGFVDKRKGMTYQPQPQLTCPHCGKIASTRNIKYWHLDNCKFNPGRNSSDTAANLRPSSPS